MERTRYSQNYLLARVVIEPANVMFDIERAYFCILLYTSKEKPPASGPEASKEDLMKALNIKSIDLVQHYDVNVKKRLNRKCQFCSATE